MAVKVAPDLTEQEVAELAETFKQHEVDAVIATNTTMSREGVEDLPNGSETGGLSGRPVFDKSTEVVAQFRQYLGEDLPIIAAGGIMSGEDAKQKMNAGANLVQIYSGFIYKGPALIRDIINTLEVRN
jgi:dihydroorotate dehydrogenase